MRAEAASEGSTPPDSAFSSSCFAFRANKFLNVLYYGSCDEMLVLLCEELRERERARKRKRKRRKVMILFTCVSNSFRCSVFRDMRSTHSCLSVYKNKK